MTVEELFKAFKAEAFDIGDTLDLNDEYDWSSLAFGFAIAKGVGAAMAFHLQLYWQDFGLGNMTIEQIVAEYDPNIFAEQPDCW